MKILYIYKYAILGGVTTQLSNRLQFLKNQTEAHFAFLKDCGGLVAFKNYEHKYIISNEEELSFLVKKYNYDFIIVIDTNEVYKWIENIKYRGIILNEVHTTTENLYKLAELKDKLPMKAIITPSNYLKNRIEDELGFKDIVPIHVVPNCLDFNDFKYYRTLPRNPKKIILWVGKLDDHKRWTDFIEIASTINFRRDDVEFWMVGGITANQQVIESMMRLVELNGLMEKFRWISSINYLDMPKLYSIVSKSGGVYVSTTTDESFGMTVIESISCNLPVVVPKVGALPEVLENISEFMLYESKDFEKAVELIELFLDNEDIKNEYVKKAQQYINKRYSIDKVGDVYLNLLLKKVGG